MFYFLEFKDTNVWVIMYKCYKENILILESLKSFLDTFLSTV